MTGAEALLREWDKLTRGNIVPHHPHEPVDWAALRAAYPHPQRIVVALRLATDLETCRALLNGEPVDPERLDKNELDRARNRRLVRLDFTEIDHLAAA